MPDAYTELLARLRGTVRTASLEEIRRRLDQRIPMVLLDVREPDEMRAGMLPGAVPLPRGSLEMEIERRVPDKSAPIVTYCAAGERSLLAAQCLLSLGYAHVESASPGFVRWKEAGYPVEVPAALTALQRERYLRHIRLPQLGERGQVRLLQAKVLVVGAGGLGSASAFYLAAAGVGTLGIADADRVDLSNLQRQILHTTPRLGMRKVTSAAKTLSRLNPEVTIVRHDERVTAANAQRLFAAYDVVVDGSDNFPTRYLVNDAGVLAAKPIVHGLVHQFEGQVTTFVPRVGPCYRCWYPEAPPTGAVFSASCTEAGVLGATCGVIGSLQATEAIKLVLGVGDGLVGRVLVYDALRMEVHTYQLRRRKDCAVCGDSPTIRSCVDSPAACCTAPR